RGPRSSLRLQVGGSDPRGHASGSPPARGHPPLHRSRGGPPAFGCAGVLTDQCSLIYTGSMDTTSSDLQRTSRLFQALSDETRLQIVQRLSGGGECCVCDMQEGIGAYQSRLSFHLKKLKEAGLVSDRKEGRWVYYTLRPEALEEMRAFLGAVQPDESTWSPP